MHSLITFPFTFNSIVSVFGLEFNMYAFAAVLQKVKRNHAHPFYDYLLPTYL